MSWVHSVQFGKPSDPRLRHLLRLRQEFLRDKDMDVHIAYVNTKRNIVADEASRGRLDLAVEELVKNGWSESQISQVNLNEHPNMAPADLPALLAFLVETTEARNRERAR